jgi:hypothetical protein
MPLYVGRVAEPSLRLRRDSQKSVGKKFPRGPLVVQSGACGKSPV